MRSPYTEQEWRELCKRFGYSDSRIKKLWQRARMQELEERVACLERAGKKWLYP